MSTPVIEQKVKASGLFQRKSHGVGEVEVYLKITLLSEEQSEQEQPKCSVFILYFFCLLICGACARPLGASVFACLLMRPAGIAHG